MPYDAPATQAGRSFVLPRRSTLVLDGARGTTIAVVRGSLWVTQEHDMRDIILEDGARFVIDRNGRTIIAAEEESRLRLKRAKTRLDLVLAWLKRVSAVVTQILAASATAEGSVALLSQRKQLPYY
ncbi:MAG TPA: DUF2917 domain-containing protein [Casimicrobiaceae bacterium]|nr:DUF2917 domain-containing protein [Casimicrobiaceae bacterium]